MEMLSACRPLLRVPPALALRKAMHLTEIIVWQSVTRKTHLFGEEAERSETARERERRDAREGDDGIL